MTIDTARMSSKGQIVLPAKLRAAHQWESGTEFRITETAEGILLAPLSGRAETTLDEVAGCLHYAGPPVSVEDMHRGIEAEARRRHDLGRY
jgi:AbrB family looped-hinge helix DNA binding protein